MDNIKNKEKTIKKIIYYIHNLHLIVDDEIFKIKDREKLGKYYFDKILKDVTNANKELVEKVILQISPHIEKQGLSCYEILLQEINIYNMPNEEMKFVKDQFQKVFEIDLEKLKNTYTNQLKKLKVEIKKITEEIEKNKQNARITYRKIEEDLGKYLKNEQEYLYRRKLLETQKMEIEFLYQDVIEKIEKYFEEENIPKIKYKKKYRKAIKCLLKKEALMLARQEDEEYAKINPFRYYEIIINREKSIIDDPESLNYISITYVPQFKAQKEAYYAFARGCSYENKKILDASEIMLMRQKNEKDYTSFLEDIIEQNSVISEIQNILLEEEIYNIRKKTLLELMEQYKRKEYYGFVAGIPSQIEGMFYDWLRDLTNYSNFKELQTFYDKLLKDKIQIIKQNDISVETPIIAYYFTFFNDLKRNRTAHGKMEYSLVSMEIKTIADELILDLYTLLHLSSDIYGNESKQIKRLLDEINDTDDIDKKRQLLQSNLLGTRTFLGFPHISKIPPMKFAYWLLNPYYYENCKSWGYETKINNVRNLFYEKEMWDDLLEKIRNNIKWKYNFAKISKEFINVVIKIKELNGFEPETKRILTDIIKEGNELLKQDKKI